MAALNETAFNLSGTGADARQLNGILTTYNLFSVLGVKPLLGRSFLPEEDHPGVNHVALLSYALWKSQFGGDRRILGSIVRLNSEPYTIVGVMPAGFSFPEKEVNPIDVWTPRAFTAEELSARGARYLLAIGRLHPGVSVAQTNAALRALTTQTARQFLDEMQGVSRFFAEPLQDSDTHEAKRGLMMLLVAVGFILVIACGNVANLLVSRGLSRSREVALRMALGARRSRIISQLLIESALLSTMGGLLGAAIPIVSLGFLKHLVPSDLSSVSLQFNFEVFAFTILVCLLSTLLFGLAPALQTSKADLNETTRRWPGNDRFQASRDQSSRCWRNCTVADVAGRRRTSSQEPLQAAACCVGFRARSNPNAGLRYGRAAISRLVSANAI
ncbi:MAG: ABC transporter permease [Bryobacteraceae bacterium]